MIDRAVGGTRKSRTSIFVGTAACTAIYQLAVILTGFLVPRLIIGAYGSEVNGLVSSLTQFIAYFALVEAGISGAAVVMLYKPLADESWSLINKILTAAKRFYQRSGYVFVVLVLLLAVLYPAFGRVTFLSNVEIALLVIALGGKGCIDFFTLSKYRVLLTADRKTWVIQLASALYQILNTVIIALLIEQGCPVVIVYYLSLVAVFARTVILVVYTKRHYRKARFNVNDEGMTLDQRWDVLFLQLLGVVQQGAPIIIATIVLEDYSLVSVFSIYLLISSGLQQLPNFLATGLQASFGELIAKNEKRALKKAYAAYELLTYVTVVVVCACGFVLIMPFVSLYMAGVTDQNYFYPALGFFCVLNVVLYHAKSPQGLLIIAAGHYRETRWRSLAQAIILVVASTVLGIQFGMVGIFAGMCVSNIYRSIDLLFYVPTQITDERISSSVRRLASNAMALVASIVICAQLPISANTWFEWFVWAVGALAISGVLVLLVNVIVNKTEFRMIWSKILRK